MILLQPVTPPIAVRRIYPNVCCLCNRRFLLPDPSLAMRYALGAEVQYVPALAGPYRPDVRLQRGFRAKFTTLSQLTNRS